MKKYYTPNFRAEVIRSYLGGKAITQLAKENGISRSTIYIWIDEAQKKEDEKSKQSKFTYAS